MPSKLQGALRGRDDYLRCYGLARGLFRGAVGARAERALGLRLVFVHALTGRPRNSTSLSKQLKINANRAVEKITDEAGVPGGAEIRIEFGDRAERLAQVAAEEGADLIVLGAREGGFRGRQLRCTLARELEAATPVPVMIAPPRRASACGHRLSFADSRARARTFRRR